MYLALKCVTYLLFFSLFVGFVRGPARRKNVWPINRAPPPPRTPGVPDSGLLVVLPSAAAAAGCCCRGSKAAQRTL